jgi:methyl-accepting chemotaxis protein
VISQFVQGLSLRAKILSFCVLSAVFIVGVAAMNYVFLEKIHTRYERVTSVDLPLFRAMSEMRVQFRVMRAEATRLVSAGITPEVFDASVEATHKAIDNYEKADEVFQKLEESTGSAREQYLAMDHIWEAHKELVAKLATTLKGGTEKEKDDARKAIVSGEFMATGVAYDAAINKVVASHEASTEASVAAAREAAETSAKTSTTLGLLALVASLALGYLLARGLSSSMTRMAAQLGDGAQSVASSSTQIAQAGGALAASATQQAAALQQTVAAIDQVSAMVQRNADSARRAQGIGDNSSRAVASGKTSVDEMMTSIDEISRSNGAIMQEIDHSNVEIGQIVKVIAEIGNKTKVINDIVFQTKLLSFNASVEAARAGEHGKGFAVVAEEVGNLAQMSGNAAKEISQMLDESIQRVETTVRQMGERTTRLLHVGKEKVDAGLETARRCGRALDEIVQNVGELGQTVGEIATASREQAQGVQEITRAMAQLDQVTQQNAASAQEASRAGDSLNEQAAAMHVLVAGLSALVHGGGHGVALPAAAFAPVAGAPRPATATPKPGPARPQPAARSTPATKTARVVPMKSATRAATSAPAPRRAGAPAPAAATSSNAALAVPDENDPRFDDV